MARPSKIDRLPPEIRDKIGALRRNGRSIDEILSVLRQLDVDVSRTGLGRHVKRIDDIGARLRESRAAAEAIMSRLGESPDNRTARLNIELMHANVLQLLAGGDDDKPVVLDPQGAMLLARTMKDLAAAAKTDVDRELRLRKEFAAQAGAVLDQAEAAVAGAQATGKAIDPVEVLRKIREDVYGIVG